MYKGESTVNKGLGFISAEIVFNHITGYTQDYDTDQQQPTTTQSTINVRLQDLSKKDREYLGTKYETYKIQKVTFSKSQSISEEDWFEYDNKKYTVLQDQKKLNRNIAYCKYEERV